MGVWCNRIGGDLADVIGELRHLEMKEMVETNESVESRESRENSACCVRDTRARSIFVARIYRGSGTA